MKCIIKNEDIIKLIDDLTEQREAHNDIHGAGDWELAYPEDVEVLVICQNIIESLNNE